MSPESQFQHTPTPKHRKSRRLRKNYDVVVLPSAKAKGRYPKGRGFNKRTRIKGRPPMYVPTKHEDQNELSLWLRARRG